MPLTDIDGQRLGDSVGDKLGNRNLIINGAMQVSQRGTSSTGQTTTGYKTVDRFRVVMSSGGTYTINQSTDTPDGFSNSLHLDNTATATPGAASLLIVDYALEGSDVQRLNYGASGAESLTLSFYVKSDVAGTYTVELFTNDGDNFIGKTYSIAAGEVGTWVRRELTFTGNTATSIANDNTRGLTVGFWLAAGSDYTSGTFNNGSWDTTVANRVDSNQVNLSSSTDNDWYITGVQLEVGNTATPFEHRSYQDELARCHRYYWQQNATSIFTRYGIVSVETATTAETVIHLPTTMRIAPALLNGTIGNSTIYSANLLYTATALAMDNTSANAVCIGISSSGMTGGRAGTFLSNNTTDFYLAFNAEL